MTRLTCTLALSAAAAIAPFQANAQSADIGAELFMDYCAACHGAGGKGDGDMANLMTVPATNLTILAKNNDGMFPMLKVIHIIDGRTGVRAHGGPMPVFGRVFMSAEPGPANPYGTILESRGRVMSVAYYLESIQE
ncbi:c-type cytochrome [Albidovulum sp.]|uniref:c-type cytochrome n=1 Tax=Albidovulum sp. TaxID=1872424 RepID=UPI001DD8B7FA|nr:cytochrome c [Paracoccaceae bacterium]MCB2122047.1 cytochrome c [Paracoccaceae bacterium]MCB2143416.1 cytochrome c [Paracoccaceae bacterium]MCB2151744.1 cytochrome c [Paracoccaceae bacterium]MCO5127239.1 cytochrome c [Paracoccaceae bacterium]